MFISHSVIRSTHFGQLKKSDFVALSLHPMGKRCLTILLDDDDIFSGQNTYNQRSFLPLKIYLMDLKF